jgi:hypothetical protein
MAINNLERLHRKRHQSPVHSNVGSIIVMKVTNLAERPPPEIHFTTNEINAKRKISNNGIDFTLSKNNG